MRCAHSRFRTAAHPHRQHQTLPDGTRDTMSQANRVGKENARERVAAEKVRARKAARRRRQWTVGGTVVAVIAVSAGVAIAVNAANHKTPYAAPVGAVVDPITKNS